MGTGASLPLGEDGGAAFWDKIFKDAADWGLTTFKLDHAQSNIPNLAQAQTDLDAMGSKAALYRAATEVGRRRRRARCRCARPLTHAAPVARSDSARFGACF